MMPDEEFEGDCSEARSHITDSRFYAQNYTTGEARQIFCDKFRYQRWLEIESCLALTQAELGIIPGWAAEEISRKAHLKNLDLLAIRKGIKQTGHSLVALLRAMQAACGNGAGEFLHYGATTQDIQDTGQVLEIKDVIQIIERDLNAIAALLIEHIERCKDVVIVGRTHSQHALPKTLGVKMAVWLDEVRRNMERLQECKNRVLVAQLFGGVGTMAGFGDKGLELLFKFSEKLGLCPPLVAWHVSRDRLAEFLSTLAIITGTLGKIANEIRSLARSETREFEEPFKMGKVGSSTMPHKRNPEMSEQVVALARLVKTHAMLGFEGLIHEHERDSRALRLEWVSITDACLFTCGALNLMKAILAGVKINQDRIAANVKNSADFICSEALMFALGKKLGKQTAHQVLYEASQQAYEEQRPLPDILLSHPIISKELSPSEIRSALEPANYLGLSTSLTDRVLKRAREALSSSQHRASRKRVCPLLSDASRCTVQTQ